MGVSRNDGKGMEMEWMWRECQQNKIYGKTSEEFGWRRSHDSREKEWKYPVECQQNTVLKWESGD